MELMYVRVSGESLVWTARIKQKCVYNSPWLDDFNRRHSDDSSLYHKIQTPDLEVSLSLQNELCCKSMIHSSRIIAIWLNQSSSAHQLSCVTTPLTSKVYDQWKVILSEVTVNHYYDRSALFSFSSYRGAVEVIVYNFNDRTILGISGWRRIGDIMCSASGDIGRSWSPPP